MMMDELWDSLRRPWHKCCENVTNIGVFELHFYR